VLETCGGGADRGEGRDGGGGWGSSLCQAREKFRHAKEAVWSPPNRRNCDLSQWRGRNWCWKLPKGEKKNGMNRENTSFLIIQGGLNRQQGTFKSQPKTREGRKDGKSRVRIGLNGLQGDRG